MDVMSGPIAELARRLDELRSDLALTKIAAALAASKLTMADVAPYVRETTRTYHRATIVRRENYELLVLTWLPGQGSRSARSCRLRFGDARASSRSGRGVLAGRRRWLCRPTIRNSRSPRRINRLAGRRRAYGSQCFGPRRDAGHGSRVHAAAGGISPFCSAPETPGRGGFLSGEQLPHGRHCRWRFQRFDDGLAVAASRPRAGFRPSGGDPRTARRRWRRGGVWHARAGALAECSGGPDERVARPPE